MHSAIEAINSITDKYKKKQSFFSKNIKNMIE